MPRSAANPAAMPNLSLDAPRMPFPSREDRNGRWRVPSVSEAVAARVQLWSERVSAAEVMWIGCGPWSELRPVSRPLLEVTLGAFPAPCGTWSSASRAAPLRGLGSSRNKFVNRGSERRTNFFRAPPRKHSLALGSRAHSLTL